MRILIYGINFSPELTGIGKYSGEMAAWLAVQGHEIRVVAAPPYYPQWRIAGNYANWWIEERVQVARGKGQGASNTGQVGTLVVYRCPLWIPSKPSGLKRVLHLASFALSSLPVMLRQIFWRPDVVWVVEPALFCAPQAWLVARLGGGKAWLHIQDYEVDAAFSLGLLKGKLLRHIVGACERWLMRRFDRVSTISQRMAELAAMKGVAPARVVLFRNWVELQQDQGSRGRVQAAGQQGETAGYRTELGIASNAVVALYSGNMGGKQGLEILAEAAKLQAQEARSKKQETRGKGQQEAEAAGLAPCSLHPEPEIVFVFCGNGAGRDDLVALCENLPNVRFLDLQPAERLGELLAMADIHLLPQRADAADLVMPSKLTGMLASGRPVVATAHRGTELADVVEKFGLAVPPGDVRAFSDAIRMLASDATLHAELGRAGREYALEYLDKEIVLRKFEVELASIVDSRAA